MTGSSNEIAQLLTLDEAADILRTSPKTLRNRVSDGSVRAVKPLGALLFERSEIERLIEEGRIRKAPTKSAA